MKRDWPRLLFLALHFLPCRPAPSMRNEAACPPGSLPDSEWCQACLASLLVPCDRGSLFGWERCCSQALSACLRAQDSRPGPRFAAVMLTPTRLLQHADTTSRACVPEPFFLALSGWRRHWLSCPHPLGPFRSPKCSPALRSIPFLRLMATNMASTSDFLKFVDGPDPVKRCRVLLVLW